MQLVDPCGEWPTPAHGSTSRNGAKTWARARFTPTKATVCRASPTRSDQNVASVTGMKSPWSSARLSRRLRSGSRWTWPTIRNGGTERSARSLTFGVRSSRIGSTVVSETANRTDARFTWANSARMGRSVDPYSSRVTSSSTRWGSAAWLRMSVTRCWRVWIVPRTTSISVYRVMGTARRLPRWSNSMLMAAV